MTRFDLDMLYITDWIESMWFPIEQMHTMIINSVTIIFETKHRLTIDSRQIGHEMMQRYCNRRLQLCIINNRMSNTIQCQAECMNAKPIRIAQMGVA